MDGKKSAIIPYRFVDGRLEILLITNAHGHRWGIPKGHVEAPLKPHISAAKEAFEEAGVLGRTHPISVGAYVDETSTGLIPTYLLEVDIELDEKAWQEEHKRERLWIEADEYDKYVTDEGLLTVIKRGIGCLRSAGEYFKRVIKTYCEDYQWNLLEVDEDSAELEYDMPAGGQKRVHITRHDSTVEFKVLSFVVIKAEEKLPGAFSTTLLRRNAQKKLGFWCIEQLRDEFVYCYMQNVELKLLDSSYFAEIVVGLTEECDAIEDIIENAARK
jgi:8-oxo-dGTP pyrophosphatase MutT (NUDIX family)